MSKLVLCKTCGKEIASSAKQCPNCGTKQKSKKLKIIVGTILALAVVFIFAMAGNNDSSSRLNSNNSKNSIIFCESVDEKLNPINEGNKFSLGNVTARLKMSKSFGTDKIKVTVYKMNGAAESIYDSANQEVNPEWTTMAIPINFTDVGDYKVTISINDTEILGSGSVTIQ
ncbi:zinc ribbon domain-containing protein [Clostridium intestinale]|uniref:zinc ribbon domain-containing protein n=1 Tax=Clostridium intestinale TaxID=36845 RepID=UPI002DD65E87|nr:zinc ribbon domain-containing protein [Clostridium intestinale]WRY50714.1 zinc ribbon domain-containing protein [Clostridium intestinale]